MPLCMCVPTHEGARIGAWRKKLDRSRTRGATVFLSLRLSISISILLIPVFSPADSYSETKKEPGLDDNDEEEVEEEVKGTHARGPRGWREGGSSTTS